MDGRLISLTGATGYVGGRLLEALEREGFRIRCTARRPEYLRPRVGPGTEVVHGDVQDLASLEAALVGVDTAYYLVHSMESTASFADADRTGAENFARAARSAGVKRIVYLGGLGGGGELSSHLRSRQEVGRILRNSGVPTIELRASIILGSGSLSFEMIRALVETLPVMITPRWVTTPTQPIGIEDVVKYLRQALDLPGSESAWYEIGGPDQVSYGELMREYARQRGLERWLISVPVLSPRLSSLWLVLVTPVYAKVGRALVDSLRNETVVRDDRAGTVFDVRPLGVREAMARALVSEDRAFAATRWSDAVSVVGHKPSWGGVRFGSRLVDARQREVPCSAAQAFAPIRRIGGKSGWYSANLLWGLRGWLDLFMGGPGLRRGRRDPDQLRPGDTVDFWRVEEFEPDRLLRLGAEMKVPGRAWLQFEVEDRGATSVIHQTAMFDPVGLWGQIYWYSLWPMHRYIFGGMLRALARQATGAGVSTSPES
ncbi:MAG: SDR family oxidoreductase [Gemmatimonadales bacterium]